MTTISKESPKFSPEVEQFFSSPINSYCIVPMFSDNSSLKGMIILANRYDPFPMLNRNQEAKLNFLAPMILRSVGFTVAFGRNKQHCQILKNLSPYLMCTATQQTLHDKIKELKCWIRNRLNTEEIHIFQSVHSSESPEKYFVKRLDIAGR